MVRNSRDESYDSPILSNELASPYFVPRDLKRRRVSINNCLPLNGSD